MAGRSPTRTWRAAPPAAAPPVAQVADPATRAVFRALSRALGMGLETDRARTLLAKAIAARCGPWGDEDEPP